MKLCLLTAAANYNTMHYYHHWPTVYRSRCETPDYKRYQKVGYLIKLMVHQIMVSWVKQKMTL